MRKDKSKRTSSARTGHTSRDWAGVHMEPIFWEGLYDICSTNKITLREFIKNARERYPDRSESCAVRLEVLSYFYRRSSLFAEVEVPPQHRPVFDQNFIHRLADQDSSGNGLSHTFG